VNEFVRLL